MLRVEKQNAEVAYCKFSLPFSPNQVAMDPRVGIKVKFKLISKLSKND